MGIKYMPWTRKKVRQFNSISYDLDFVIQNDEFNFLLNTLGSFHDLEVLKLMTVKTGHKANIHVETNDKTLIKWLLKFGFEEA